MHTLGHRLVVRLLDRIKGGRLFAMIVHSNGRVDRHCVGLVGQRCSHSLSLLVGRLRIRYALPLHTSLEVVPFVVDSCQIAIVSGITTLGVVLRLLIVMSITGGVNKWTLS